MDCQQCGQPIDKTKKPGAQFCSRQCKDRYWQAIRRLERKVDRALKIITDLKNMRSTGVISDNQYQSAIRTIQQMLDNTL